MKYLTLSFFVVYVSLTGCSTPECTTDLECDDGNPCTVGSCDVGPSGPECVHEDVTCDDPNFVCDVSTGACVCDENSDCDDGTFCNGAESCFDGVCLFSNSPCEIGWQCDEDAETPPSTP